MTYNVFSGTLNLTQSISPPTHASGLTKDTMAGGGNERLTAGDVTTCHERRGIAGGL